MGSLLVAQTGICRCGIISLSCYLPILDHHIILGQIYFRNHSYFSAQQSRFVLVWAEKSQRSIKFLSPYHAFFIGMGREITKRSCFSQSMSSIYIALDRKFTKISRFFLPMSFILICLG